VNHLDLFDCIEGAIPKKHHKQIEITQTFLHDTAFNPTYKKPIPIIRK
jgi:hypothetical protein